MLLAVSHVRSLQVSTWWRTGNSFHGTSVLLPVAPPSFRLSSDDSAFTSGCPWEPAISVLGAALLIRLSSSRVLGGRHQSVSDLILTPSRRSSAPAEGQEVDSPPPPPPLGDVLYSRWAEPQGHGCFLMLVCELKLPVHAREEEELKLTGNP